MQMDRVNIIFVPILIILCTLSWTSLSFAEENGQNTGIKMPISVQEGESIQAAIDTASVGDVIEVKNGTYYENLLVFKQITLKGVGRPIIKAGINNQSVLKLYADGCKVEGFTLADGDIGLFILSNNNTLTNNSAFNNSNSGIKLYGSGNIVMSNVASYNRGDGISVFDCQNNVIASNNISWNSESGIWAGKAGNNTFEGNFINKNKKGIILYNSSSNFIYHNRLMENGDEAWDNGSNQWDNGNEGNYYSKIQCDDGDANGICDSSHAISGGKNIDRYPMAN